MPALLLSGRHSAPHEYRHLIVKGLKSSAGEELCLASLIDIV
jgi:hypothetical protein